jgi:hypothetical protein
MRAMYAHASAALRGIAVSMKGFEVIGMLERMRDIPPEIFRTVEYGGQEIRLHQYINKCDGWDNKTLEPYCRLSVELDEQAPHGWFWLKDWTENKEFVDFLIKQGVLERHPAASRTIANNILLTAARLKVKALHETTA